MKSTVVDGEVPWKLYIEGQWKDHVSAATFSIFDLASGEVLTAVAAGSERDVDAAVASAKSALSGHWRRTLPADRARILNRAAAIIRREQGQVLHNFQCLSQLPQFHPKNIDSKREADLACL